MMGAKVRETRIASYELEIEIDAAPSRVWDALVNETNAWWLPDFHMVGPDSVVHFEARAGGQLIEKTAEGGSLLWYNVQMCSPSDHSIFLVGHIAPDWGGPTTTHLKLVVEAREDGGARLLVSDSQLGPDDEGSLKSLESGWKQLFTDGLKKFVEAGDTNGD